MQTNKNITKSGIVLAAAAILTSSVSAPAHANNADHYKQGAIALGALGAYIGSRGHVLPGVATAAAGYFLYRHGRHAERNDNNRDHYSYNNDNNDRDRHNQDHNDPYYNNQYNNLPDYGSRPDHGNAYAPSPDQNAGGYDGNDYRNRPDNRNDYGSVSNQGYGASNGDNYNAPPCDRNDNGYQDYSRPARHQDDGYNGNYGDRANGYSAERDQSSDDDSGYALR